MLKNLNFITCLYRSVLEVNYLFRAESARNYLVQKYSSLKSVICVLSIFPPARLGFSRWQTRSATLPLHIPENSDNLPSHPLHPNLIMDKFTCQAEIMLEGLAHPSLHNKTPFVLSPLFWDSTKVIFLVLLDSIHWLGNQHPISRRKGLKLCHREIVYFNPALRHTEKHYYMFI